MPDQITNRVSETLSLIKRRTAVNKNIAIWIRSIDQSFDFNTDLLGMQKYGRKSGEFTYLCGIKRDVKKPGR
jgi:hypothetical protein